MKVPVVKAGPMETYKSICCILSQHLFIDFDPAECDTT